VRDRRDASPLAAMIVCSMHPTVLHEDSTLVSGDFPAMARQYLQANALGPSCPVIYHTGPCGNQSPRHVTRANNFAEAQRLGRLLGRAIERALVSLECENDPTLACRRQFVDLPRRELPALAEAEAQLVRAWERLWSLQRSDADARQVRTAECDWFGAEEAVALARIAGDGRLDSAVAAVMPAEVQLMRVGRWSFAGWPGEVYVEYALEVKAAHPLCCAISLANGELQGYLVTEEAVRQRAYEAQNSLFASAQAPRRLVETTLALLNVDAAS
jgi:neutral ceramidase